MPFQRASSALGMKRVKTAHPTLESIATLHESSMKIFGRMSAYRRASSP